MSGTILFGIKNCDTVKKARKWLETHQIEYHFHDFKTDGLSKDQLQSWLDTLGAEELINTRSTTWRQLTQKDQELAMGKAATAVVLANPTVIKRPVLSHGDQTLVGFRQEAYESLFGV